MLGQIVLTGSQVYGPATKESDIDIVLNWIDAEKFKIYLLKKNIKIEKTQSQLDNMYPGFYFYLNELKFNIICASTNEELKQWRIATNKMLESPPIKNKEKRINKFQRYFKKGVNNGK